MSKSRTISANTIKSLYSRSGNLCSFPDCDQKLIESEDINVSNICHINGLNPNSARYDPNLDEEYLNSEENLILLCPNHHKIIDADEKNYTVETLQRMKAVHESNIATALSKISSLMPNPVNTSYDYAAVQQYLCDFHEIEADIEEIKNVLNIFSCQVPNVKTLMAKILDVYHRRPNEPFKMMAVVNELSIDGKPAGYSAYVTSLIKYLLEHEYIKEWKYDGSDMNSLIDDGNGGFYDVSDNYPFKI